MENTKTCFRFKKQTVEWVSLRENVKCFNLRVTYTDVGNVLNLCLHDKDDIQLKWHEFLQQVDFQGVRLNILAQLFSKYCNSFYGNQMWDFYRDCTCHLL